jgi:hypothetical protein
VLIFTIVHLVQLSTITYFCGSLHWIFPLVKCSSFLVVNGGVGLLVNVIRFLTYYGNLLCGQPLFLQQTVIFFSLKILPYTRCRPLSGWPIESARPYFLLLDQYSKICVCPIFELAPAFTTQECLYVSNQRSSQLLSSNLGYSHHSFTRFRILVRVHDRLCLILR